MDFNSSSVHNMLKPAYLTFCNGSGTGSKRSTRPLSDVYAVIYDMRIGYSNPGRISCHLDRGHQESRSLDLKLPTYISSPVTRVVIPSSYQPQFQHEHKYLITDCSSSYDSDPDGLFDHRTFDTCYESISILRSDEAKSQLFLTINAIDLLQLHVKER